jgi:hypothetical protein
MLARPVGKAYPQPLNKGFLVGQKAPLRRARRHHLVPVVTVR